MLTQADALLKATAKAAFWQNYESYPSIMAGLVAQVTSDSDQETYPWLAYAPGVREMTGSRVKRSVPEIKWTIANKKWESTVSIPYETRKYARLNSVQALLGSMGSKARAYPDKLTSTLLNNGLVAGNTSYDGQLFFSAAHSEAMSAYTAAQSNYFAFAGTGSARKASDSWLDTEAAGAINAARVALMSFKDGEGDPVMMNPGANILIMCPVDLYASLASLKTAATLTGGAANPIVGTFDVIANPWLTAVPVAGSVLDYFYAFNTSGAHKPFIYQIAEAVGLEDDMGGDNDFMSKDVSFGTFGYYNVGFGDWRYAVKVISS